MSGIVQFGAGFALRFARLQETRPSAKSCANYNGPIG